MGRVFALLPFTRREPRHFLAAAENRFRGSNVTGAHRFSERPETVRIEKRREVFQDARRQSRPLINERGVELNKRCAG